MKPLNVTINRKLRKPTSGVWFDTISNDGEIFAITLLPDDKVDYCRINDIIVNEGEYNRLISQ